MKRKCFGYRIENGKATICEEEAGQLREIYEGYLSGLGYEEAARKAGLSLPHASVKRMLQNGHYLGDGFYPAIIDQGTFDAAEEERLRRCVALGRNNRARKTKKKLAIPTRFTLRDLDKEFDDPYAKAAYIYSLIERED